MSIPRLISSNKGIMHCAPSPSMNYYLCKNGDCELQATVWNFVHSFHHCTNFRVTSSVPLPPDRLKQIFDKYMPNPEGTFRLDIPNHCFDTKELTEDQWDLHCIRSRIKFTQLSPQRDITLIQKDIAPWRFVLFKNYAPSALMASVFLYLFYFRPSRKRK